ncbi:MAG: hypothetical protein HY390_05070 [Deltaproteobacteria bacterium]|nr:hypothetical protein [Deltaproteobacteria bacterium]
MLYKLFISRYGIFCFVFLIIQQLIVCSSTLWLTHLVISVQTGQQIWINLLLFLLSLSLPYFPGAAASIMLSQWRQITIGKYIDAFISKKKNAITLWSQKNAKEEQTAFLTAEGQETLKNTLTYFYDLCATGLNVGFNILVLSAVVEPKYAIGYGLGLVLAGLLFKFQKNKQKQLAALAQLSRVSLVKILLNAWDNILIGNHYNFNLWNKETKHRFEISRNSNVHAETLQSLVSIGIAFTTLVPVFIVIILHVSQHLHEPAILSIFVVTLPRLFGVLNYTYELLTLLFQWTTHQEKLAGVRKILSETLNESLPERIRWAKISFYKGTTPQNIFSLTDLMPLTKIPGRLTLRGENGTGKSSILMLLKEKLGEDAFYLPAKGDLFFQIDTSSFSSGETAKSYLEELQRAVPEKILLLDEWDANLDPLKREQLSQIIDTLSHRQCIIEVRHSDHPQKNPWLF